MTRPLDAARAVAGALLAGSLGAGAYCAAAKALLAAWWLA